MNTHPLTVSSFTEDGDETTQRLDVPVDGVIQRSFSVDGWDFTIYEDGTLTIERDSAVTEAVALATTADKWRVSVVPYAACPTCVQYAGRMAPSHVGSPRCESGSIASGGNRSHCSCDTCF